MILKAKRFDERSRFDVEGCCAYINYIPHIHSIQYFTAIEYRQDRL